MTGQENRSMVVMLKGLAVALLSLVLATGKTWGAEKELTSHFSWTQKYDDNPSRGSQSSNRGQGGGGDWVTALNSQLLFHYTTALSRAQLDYQAEREFFHGRSRLNNTSQAGAFRYDTRVAPWLRGGISDSLRFTEDVDTDLDPRGLRFNSSRSRSRKRANILNLFLEPQLSSRLSLKMDYSNTFTDVDVADEADELQHGLGASLNYLTDTLRSDALSLSYRMSIHTFDGNEGRNGFVDDDEEEDFLTHTVQLGYTRHLTPSLSLSLRGGLSRISSDDPEEDGDQDFTGGVTLDQAWQKTRLSLGFNQEMGSGGEGHPILSRTASALFSRQFSPRLQFSVNGSFSDNDSRGGNDPAKSRRRSRRGGSEEDSTFWSTGVNLGYQAATWWSTTASYHLSARRPKGSREQAGRERENEKYRGLQVGFRFNPSRTWQADLNYSFSRRNGRTDFNDREQEDPERNQLWLTFTLVTPWKF